MEGGLGNDRVWRRLGPVEGDGLHNQCRKDGDREEKLNREDELKKIEPREALEVLRGLPETEECEVKRQSKSHHEDRSPANKLCRPVKLQIAYIITSWQGTKR